LSIQQTSLQATHEKPFQLFGMGNALLDMEFEVDEQFLQKLHIEKGIMTLVDEDRQREILSHIHHMGHKRACGGSAANTLIAFAQLGGHCHYAHKVAEDEVGHFYRANLQENGVNFSPDRGLVKGTTGRCLVLITPDADRTMNTFLGITQTFGEKEVCYNHLQNSDFLYVEGYLFTMEEGYESALKAKAKAVDAETKIVLSLSDPFVVKVFKERIKRFLQGGVDFIFCNEREALDLWETNDLNEAIEKMKSLSQGFAITLGNRGSYIFDGHQGHSIQAYKVKAVDTNGAGDMFAGAFLYGMIHGFSLRHAADLASRASAEVVANYGPRLPKESLLSLFRERQKAWEMSEMRERKSL
jgi:sugar/nucleoside kinase (ribokinase family)